MNKINVKINLLDNYPSDEPPKYATEQSSGFDLYAAIDNNMNLKPGERVLVPAGIKLEIPHGFEGQVRPRSGLAVKSGITVLNTPGTVDADYRGEVKIILINLGENHFLIERGMRIAQMVIAPIQQVEFNLNNNLSNTERDGKGFGSSGL